MSLSSTVVNTTFTASQVSYGAASAGTSSYTYTEAGPVPQSGTATVTSYDAATNAITATLNTTFGTATLSGTVIGNDANDFLISGKITYPVVGTISGYVYVTNNPASQPGSANSTTVPFESANIVYTPACYCSGTLIRTPYGPRPVEELAIGDQVSCVNGGTATVRWVGRRSYAGRFLRANPRLRPVRFRPNSLGPGMPSRDLLVSPRHAMLIEGVLVPAELLVDGDGVLVDHDADTVEYIHLELPHHDAVWAEDAPSESFVDDGSRGKFHNAHTFEALYPDQPPAEPVFCAPVVTGGEALERIRHGLAVVWRSAA